MEKLWYTFLDHFYGSYTQRILMEALQLLYQLWPYLVAGIILSSAIKVFVSKQGLAKIFTNKLLPVSIPLAALIGVISPLGSYITIPLCTALLAIGLPLPMLMALMVASPIINPNLFILTAGAMNYEMAIMRVIAALTLGTTAGYVTQILIRRKKLDPTKILKTTPDINQWIQSEPDISFKAFYTDLYRMSRFISKYFFLAILVAAAVKILANPSFILRYLNDNSFLGILLSTAAGVPFYVCGGAAIPVVQQLAEFGLSSGAVLAYFISGPVTKIANLAMLKSAFTRIILSIYLVVGLGGALLFGVIYNLFK